MNVDAIPLELRELPRWVVWRWGDVDPKTGKRKKPPYCPHDLSRHASNKKPADWGTFDQAAGLVREGKAHGIGLALEPPYVGFDLDDGLSDVDQAAIVLALRSYTETSPSGDGQHVVVKATLNGRGRHPKDFGVFTRDRFFYFTGQHVTGTPTTIEERQAQLDQVLERFLPKPETKITRTPSPEIKIADDRDLLDVMFGASNGDKIRRLWNGDTSGNGDDHSAADLALCSHLAFYTGNDRERIDRLFRSSGLMRDKWERDDYREKTIQAAIAGTKDVYNPSARNVVPTLNPRKPPLFEERGVPSDFPGGRDLQGVLDAFAELLVMPDPGAVELALAAVVANYAPGDCVWPLLVGPPGCGKSEIVSALTSAPGVWPLSSLTPQTLLSGFERKGKDKGPPASMLLQIGEFGILAFKDLTTVLTMHREARAQIIGQLREVADGKTEKNFGNGLRVEWEGKLGLVAGVTPVIDEQHAFLAVMGERFVLYRMPEVARREIATRSLARRGREGEIRDRIASTVGEFLARFRNVGRLELPDHFTEQLVTLADMVTRSRSAVARDYQTRDILYLPEPEAPTRLAKQIAQLMAAALAIGVDETEAWRLARKVGWDSVPAIRSGVIRLLARYEGEELTRADLMEKTGLPETTVRRVEEDLVVLGLVDHRKESNRWLIRQSNLARDYWNEES